MTEITQGERMKKDEGYQWMFLYHPGDKVQTLDGRIGVVGVAGRDRCGSTYQLNINGSIEWWPDEWLNRPAE